MPDIFKSVNAENVPSVKERIKINLQLFAEDDEQFQEAEEIETNDNNFDFNNEMSKANQLKEEQPAQPELATPKPPKVEQTPEENTKFAAARREAEAKAKAAEEKALKIAQKAGFDSIEAMETYLDEQEKATKDAKFKEDFGVDPEVVREALKQTPEWQKFEQDKQEKEENQKRTEQEAALKVAITELNTEYPEYAVKGTEELANLPNFEKIVEYAKKGYDLVDAFEKANRDILRQKMTGAIKQATLNSLNSKSHLKPDAGSVEFGDNIISNEELEIAKKLGISEEQFRKNYGK